jgi:hypothetical protein
MSEDRQPQGSEPERRLPESVSAERLVAGDPVWLRSASRAYPNA